MPQLPDEAGEPLRYDPHFQRILLHVDPLDQELDDARLPSGKDAHLDETRGGAPRVELRLRVVCGPTAGISATKKPTRGQHARLGSGPDTPMLPPCQAPAEHIDEQCLWRQVGASYSCAERHC